MNDPFINTVEQTMFEGRAICHSLYPLLVLVSLYIKFLHSIFSAAKNKCGSIRVNISYWKKSSKLASLFCEIMNKLVTTSLHVWFDLAFSLFLLFPIFLVPKKAKLYFFISNSVVTIYFI